MIQYKISQYNMQLGQQVLNKISDLLVEIDRPKSPKRKPKKIQEIPQQQNNNNDDRLYQNFKKLKDKAHEREKDKLKQEMQRLRPFKVDNKHSIFLNSRKNLKPIHQRTADIIRQKQVSLEKTRAQVERQRQMRKKLMHPEQDQEAIEQYNRSKSQKRIATKQELDQILKRLTQRERQRMEKNNREKMDYLKEKLLNNTEKPYMNKKSEKLWQKMKMQKELSENVFQRFQRYNYDKKKSHQKYVNKIREKQTPFKPEISKNSIQILNKSSTSRLQLCRELDRSRSCKCFVKHANSQRSFMNNTSANLNASTNNISSTQSKSRVTATPNK